ncbi:MAG: HAD-IA family hydrolase, partial [Azonexus sp.]|nr:HAD-IA family hydrolase [Azonexus sp.]
IERHLGVDESEATRIRQDYWIRYGATLRGLMHHHGTNPNHFLWETHQFPDLQRMLDFQKPMLHTLRKLPGKKIIFSNAPRHYANAILGMTGLDRHFSAIYSLENLRFQPKPMLAGFRTLLRAEHLDPKRCIMVEDSLANLVSAKKLGMKTVWVSTGLRQSPFVDVKIKTVLQLPERCGRL